MCIISDFPGLDMISGWNTYTTMTCPFATLTKNGVDYNIAENHVSCVIDGSFHMIIGLGGKRINSTLNEKTKIPSTGIWV